MQLFRRIQNRNFFMTPNNEQNKTTNVRVPSNKIMALVIPPSSPGWRNGHEFSTSCCVAVLVSWFTNKVQMGTSLRYGCALFARRTYSGCMYWAYVRCEWLLVFYSRTNTWRILMKFGIFVPCK
jgi:hypothetical protein